MRVYVKRPDKAKWIQIGLRICFFLCALFFEMHEKKNMQKTEMHTIAEWQK